MVGVNFGVYFLRDDGGRDLDTPLEVIVRHVDYLVERLGIERVGFGSDFDGASVPQDLGDVTGLPRLLDVLRQSGYDEPSLRKLAHENWVRVLSKTWRE
jgi:membrane dipeptidase